MQHKEKNSFDLAKICPDGTDVACALIPGADLILQLEGTALRLSLLFFSTDSEPGNSTGHSSSVQECQLPKYHRGKVRAAPRQGGLRARQVSIAEPLGWGTAGWQRAGNVGLGRELWSSNYLRKQRQRCTFLSRPFRQVISM